jgi:hypothetical protein
MVIVSLCYSYSIARDTLSAGAIAGITLAIVIPLIIILLFIGCRRRRRRHDTADTFAASEMVSPFARLSSYLGREAGTKHTHAVEIGATTEKQQSLRSNTPEAGILEKVDFSHAPQMSRAYGGILESDKRFG